MKTRITFSAFILLAVLLIACRKNNTIADDKQSSQLQLSEQADDYPRSTNDHLAALGRVLFYDKNLSLNNSVSCSSCHDQAKAFCDGKRFSSGLINTQTNRNAPSIFFRSGRLFWDARAANMESLVLKPVQNHVEMRIEDLSQLAKKISLISYYPSLFKKAFGSPSVDTIKIQLAMTEFMKNFTFNANRFVRSVDRKEPLETIEELGKEIFFGKARCSSCHTLKDDGTGNNGGGYGGGSNVLPRAEFNIGLDAEYQDKGVGELSGVPEDYGKFNIPLLFNVEYTAPYMHDGRFNTLEEVVEHYNSGVKTHPNLDIRLREIGDLMKLNNAELLTALDKNGNNKIDNWEMSSYEAVKLNLTSFEKKALVAFLKTLSDPRILTDKKFSNPFK